MRRIILLCVLFAHTTHAVITELYTLRNQLTGQTIHFFGDKHVDVSYAHVQRKALLKRFKKAMDHKGRDYIFCLVEDMMTPNGTHPELVTCLSRSHHYVNKKLQLLEELVADMRTTSIPVYNIECRQLMEVALQKYNITATEVFDALCDLIRQLRAYPLSRTFKSIINRQLTTFERTVLYPLTLFFNQLEQHNGLFYQALKKTPYHRNIKGVLKKLKIQGTPQNYSKQKEFVLEYFDNELVDLVALAQIGLHSTTRHIIVCAGAEHVRRIIKELQKLGLKLIAKQSGTVELPDCNARRKVKAVDVDAFYQKFNRSVQAQARRRGAKR